MKIVKSSYTIEVTKKTGLYDIEVNFQYKTRLGNEGLVAIGVDVNTYNINVSATGPLAADDDGVMEGFVKAINLAKDLSIGNVTLID